MSDRKRVAVLERIRDPQVNALHLALRGAFARAYAPPPKMPLSEWADKYRVLSAESAAVAGRWRTSNEPMAKGVMDALTDPLTEKVSAMVAAQVLKTEFVLNAVGYYAHGEPGPMLVVYPTVEAAEMFSTERLSPMIRDTPVLRKLFAQKSRDTSAKILQKAFPGGRISMVGANAPTGLASRPIRFVLCDECDRFPASAGGQGAKGEGDPIGLAEERTSTFPNRKIVLVSTPTTKGFSRIESSFEEGDQRRYHVPCPHCAVRQVITWQGVKWGKDADGAHDPSTAHYVCREDAHDPTTGVLGCGKAWTEAQRQDAVSQGVWIASKPFKGHASFHASQLSSKRVPLSQIVKKFLDAKNSVEKLKKWTNLSLAETFEEGGEKADPGSLLARRENYPAGYAEHYDVAYQFTNGETLPAGVGLITAGVDIQGNRFECELVGWGVNEERWSLDYVVKMGDPTMPQFWDALDEVLQRRFLHPTGQVMTVAAACVDSGFATQAVHTFTGPRAGRRVWAIKGVAGAGRPIWPPKATKNLAKKTDTYILGIDQAKGIMQGRLMLAGPGPAYCHFPKRAPYEQAYFDMATVEKAITKYKHGHPFKEWSKPDGARNEAWDCIVYSYAAYFSTPVDIALRLHELNAAAEKRAASPQPTAPTAIPSAGRRRGVRAGGATA